MLCWQIFFYLYICLEESPTFKNLYNCGHGGVL